MEQPNTNYIDQISSDDLDFRAKIIAILKEELPLEIEQVKSQLLRSAFTEAAQSVHKLKHKISILGLEKSYYIAEDFELNLKDNNTILQPDFEEILKVMQQFVLKL